MGQITITDVAVSPDSSFAKVFFTRLGEDHDKSTIEDILNKAQGFVRTHIAKNLNIRVAPHISFKYDDTL